MEHCDKKKLTWGNFNVTNIATFTTCFLAGIYVGRKLSSVAKRVAGIAYSGPTKLALVVRTDLKMGTGKVAAQCGHGTLLAYRQLQQKNPQLLQAWEDSGQAKVVLKAANLCQMKELLEMAREQGINAALVRDSGRTQVSVGTETVLVVGPDRVAHVDKITGKLKLL